MSQKAVLFDLDGTLTDSGEGIINCAILALEHFSLPVPDREALRVFVGPPLRDSFLRFGIRGEQLEEAVEVFRGRYTTKGKFENFPYPGIPEMLQQLKSAGFRLYVATSKPEIMALEIMDHFGLAPYFDQICGAAMDKSRDTKESVIAYLLKVHPEIRQPLMVGDTSFDVLGAAAHGIPTVGVAWGYGDTAEMEKAGAVAIADTPAELFRIISQKLA